MFVENSGSAHFLATLAEEPAFLLIFLLIDFSFDIVDVGSRRLHLARGEVVFVTIAESGFSVRLGGADVIEMVAHGLFGLAEPFSLGKGVEEFGL